MPVYGYGSVYYTANNPNPKYAYNGEEGFGSLSESWSDDGLKEKVESMIAHFNRIAEKGYEDEQCLIDDPKAVIEKMTHYAYVLNSDIYA